MSGTRTPYGLFLLAAIIELRRIPALLFAIIRRSYPFFSQ